MSDQLMTEVTISIHAPARGAILIKRYRSYGLYNFNPRTCTRCDGRLFVCRASFHYFNPRTCTRCDLITENILDADLQFQSTHLHEVRFVPAIQCSTLDYFNPRTCTRCDSIRANGKVRKMVFQSTHLHEVRCSWLPRIGCPSPNFNPRTCTRCDRKARGVCL